MKWKAAISVLILACNACFPGEFVNLTFDNPDLSGIKNPTQSADAPMAQLLRGWSVYYGNSPEQMASYVPLESTFGSRDVTLLQNTADQAIFFGTYSVLIIPSPIDAHPPLYIKQSGEIPIDAEALTYWAPGGMEMSIDGTKLGSTIFPYPGGPLAVDVSAYRGKTVELQFTLFAPAESKFDILGFTVMSVPEPSTWSLLGGGIALLIWARVFRRERR